MSPGSPLTPRYPILPQIKDPILQKAFKAVFDKLATLESQALIASGMTTSLQTTLDANRQRLTSVADPVVLTDAVNLQTLQAYVEAAMSQAAQTAREAVVVPPSPAPDPTPTPNGPWLPAQSGTGLVRIGGQSFTLGANGPLWPWRGCTDFRLYQRYLDGENITPILDNRIASGATTLRVLGMMYNIANFYPKNYSTYFSSLPTFCDVLLARGLWLEFTCLADCQYAPLGLTQTAEQVAHVSQVVVALAGKSNVFFELANEYSNNGVDPSKFARPVGILSSAGWGSPTGDVYLPPWDYVTHHPDRDDQWPRKSKDIQDIRDGPFGIPPAIYTTGVKRPVVSDEPMGAGDVDIPNKRSTVVNDFYWAGAGCALFGAGGTFHSDNGIQSVVFSPTQQACANAWYSGMAAIPTAVQNWQYTRGGLADCPIEHDDSLALRTYAKISGNTAVVLVIRPTASWLAVPVPPWTITGTTGPSGTVLTLSK